MNGERVIRSGEWARPVRPVRREVLSARPELDEGQPPLLFVPGFGHGAWAYAEHWLGHTAARGFPAYAVSLRGHGGSGPAPEATLRAYAHDVVQVAASLPRQAVLVGHGAGALVVAHALARYPARAAVLVAPVLGGWATFGAALRRNPLGTLPAVFGGGLRLSRRQLFGRETPDADARRHTNRLGRAARRAQWELLTGTDPEPPVGGPPVLVLGSPDDRVLPATALTRAARRYGSAPLLFPGMGHDLMLDARWQEPIDAILDWLVKNPIRGEVR
ncbi:alpha/beta hydrolase [Micromonospora endophytica]|uniref:Alpha/beta hydrolase n=1 Tax=Micromonospora endophytica TaxID=515350 RepID=A0A2W2CMG4_9ACTN|nr:alpha/beta fold hydrolase [Micromonospora endophytica]PZF99732.1 alpha/beta hydrolase [Micromonospora endophytica]RIW48554.1 alpha/beta fold hydrolase [Micromonospora endophytica]BCJ61107.1 alpha/beta hydrolase [Micromonospora endophytica]